MPPLTWLVLGDKIGDNAQVELIADALGWPFERKSLVFLPQFRTGKPRFRPTLSHLDRDLSAALEAPWPDLIITIGRRPSMAALAVRELSGNRSRVVMIGRPRRLPELALGVVTPQYSVPAADNVMHLDYPLMKIDTDAILAEKFAHAASMSRLPRPLTAVLVGGST
ncbi:MAG: mitochondrial fission ELM1 family protein, partial [Chromatiales bacterium]|nr:mitochondrial fission ELM1 family protein [Chromatiales bacterium]